MTPSWTAEDLKRFIPRHRTFVGVDSDGCVFDTMAIKQKQFFHGRIVSFWDLQPLEAEVRQAAEFVNLHSRWRGSNRFPALLRIFRLLRQWPAAANAGVQLPDDAALQCYVDSGLPLGNPSLRHEVEHTDDPELRRLLDWSEAVSAAIAADLPPVPPFREARRALQRMRQSADICVVSQTPEADLVREWQHHGLLDGVDMVAGQELGTKTQHLQLAAAGRYAPDRILMIGDSLHDLEAARNVGARFYPIVPGAEEESWRELCETGYDCLTAGAFAGPYETGHIKRFEAQLTATPPWLA